MKYTVLEAQQRIAQRRHRGSTKNYIQQYLATLVSLPLKRAATTTAELHPHWGYSSGTLLARQRYICFVSHERSLPCSIYWNRLSAPNLILWFLASTHDCWIRVVGDLAGTEPENT
ncbi:unnamed protein product, partial [Pylaiella littoralis]